MAVAGAEALFGLVGGAGVELERAGGGHDEEVAQIGVAGAAEVGVREADDGFILVLVAGAVLVHLGVVLAVLLVADGIGIGGELHHTKRHRGPRKRVPHPLGTHQRVRVLHQVFGGPGGLGEGRGGGEKGGGEEREARHQIRQEAFRLVRQEI